MDAKAIYCVNQERIKEWRWMSKYMKVGGKRVKRKIVEIVCQISLKNLLEKMALIANASLVLHFVKFFYMFI